MESALQGDCRRKRREIHRAANKPAAAFFPAPALTSLSGASVEERAEGVLRIFWNSVSRRPYGKTNMADDKENWR